MPPVDDDVLPTPLTHGCDDEGHGEVDVVSLGATVDPRPIDLDPDRELASWGSGLPEKRVPVIYGNTHKLAWGVLDDLGCGTQTVRATVELEAPCERGVVLTVCMGGHTPNYTMDCSDSTPRRG